MPGRPGGSTWWRQRSGRSAGRRPPRPGRDTWRAVADRRPAMARQRLALWPPESTTRRAARRSGRQARLPGGSRWIDRIPVTWQSWSWPYLRQRALAEDDESLAIAGDGG